jgi:hypothetical protein
LLRFCSYQSVAPNIRGDISSQGSVHVFLRTSLTAKLSKPPTQQQPLVTLQAFIDADFTLQNNASFEYFGQNLEIVKRSPAVLLVGAPYFHIDATNNVKNDNVNSAVGRVFAYSFDEGMISSVFSITGCRHASRLGQSMAYSSSLDVLAIAEPSHNATFKPADNRFTRVLRGGRALLVPMSSLVEKASASLNKEISVCDVETWDDVASVEGTEVEGRFGAQMVFAQDKTSKRDRLIVSAPVASTGGDVFSVIVTFAEGKLRTQTKKLLSGGSVGEGKGRLGYRLATTRATTDDHTERATLVFASAPFADCSGTAPDNDEVGSLRAILLD